MRQSAVRLTPSSTHETNNRMRLRSATRDIHVRSERRWLPDVPSEFPLHEFLSTMHRVHIRMGLAAASLDVCDVAMQQERSRIEALELDLGHRPERPQTSTCQAQHTRDWAWGALYALNGSALGASVLIREALGDNANDSAYLATMRTYAKSGRLAAFFRSLNAQNLNLTEATAGASDVFAAILADTASSKRQPDVANTL